MKVVNVQMQDDNVKKILYGEKTTTIRSERQFIEIGLNIGETGITNFSAERRYTPDYITALKENEVFVFGSNAKGIHGKGSALLAKQLFGAIQGNSEGLQGKSYAIITKKDWKVEKSSTLNEIYNDIYKFLIFAQNTPHKNFLVTKLGSSLAGYSVTDIKALFYNHLKNIPNNVILPKEYEVRSNLINKQISITNRGLLSIDEAGGKDIMLKSEGITTENDLKYVMVADWFTGAGKLYVYDLIT